MTPAEREVIDQLKAMGSEVRPYLSTRSSVTLHGLEVLEGGLWHQLIAPSFLTLLGAELLAREINEART